LRSLTMWTQALRRINPLDDNTTNSNAMKYLLINPFDPQVGNGVNAYYQSLKACLEQELELVEFTNDKNASISLFRKKVLAFVEKNFDRHDVIIEAPETKSATLLLDRGYKTHVRLHAPLAICQKYEGTPINQARFSAELRVIAQAAVVSSPSYALVREIANHLVTSEFVVNKNPILKIMPFIPKVQRQYDAIFMGRFHVLKGAQYLNAVLALLPQDYKVALIGPGAQKFQPENPEKIAFVSDHIAGDQRFDLLADAKVCLVPSLFENCSMMILEAIAAGVPVVAWRRGGNGEFPADIVKTVEFDQINTYAAAVIDAVDGVEISKPRVDEVVSAINADFVAGVRNVIDRLSNQATIVYRSRFGATA